ncbi:MAG: AAA family ATPase, partial [Thermoplasmata archaeon]|nr:AAA family ATPase [Thermoplasmata archaeon]
DSIAPTRGRGTDTGVTERIVNQLLTSMDGIEDMRDVLVIAATNRPDMVDPALLRTGRFDKIILVSVPNEEGRKKIFQVHTRNMPLDKDVDLDALAHAAEGYVGADIEGLCREAAMVAIRENKEAKKVCQKHFQEALCIISSSVSEETIKYYESIKSQLEQTVPKREERDDSIARIYG